MRGKLTEKTFGVERQTPGSGQVFDLAKVAALTAGCAS
jgi:hypothetical protein